MKKILLIVPMACMTICWQSTVAQVNARLFQFPDVSASHITFAYAGDIWVVPKEGGIAHKLSSPPGEETFPKFSPDGSMIAFSGNYSGNIDAYVIPTMGGLPVRLTYHGMQDRVVDWNPDGMRVLFASSRESGSQRFNQFYLAPAAGGMAVKLPIAYGEMGSYSPDGKKIVYTERTRLFRTWKRYKGGMAADMIMFDLENLISEMIAADISNDELPMWSGNQIYFLSDRGPEIRHNLWVYDIAAKTVKKITDFTDTDVHFPSIGPEDIVFEAGGELYLYNIQNGKYNKVNITVVTDEISLSPKLEKVNDKIFWQGLSPDGKRLVVEARGDLFSVPAENGYVKNLTRTSGIAERYPYWSPDGKSVAYWSDRSGEYELTLMDVETGSERKLTSYGPGFRYKIFWSPDSKKIAFVEQTNDIKIFDIAGNRTLNVDKDLWLTEGSLQNFSMSWSADSRWLAYGRGLESRNNAIFVFDSQGGIRHQVTSGFYNDNNPVFDPEGNYLYYLTNRSLSPVYSDFDNAFIYPNSTQVAVVTLRNDVKSPLEPENDEVTLKKEDEKEEDKEVKEKKGKKESKEEEKPEEEVKTVLIDIQGFEYRTELLPAESGNYNNLSAAKGKIAYQKFPNGGAADKNRPVKFYDFKEREEKTLIDDADFYSVAYNGEKVLLMKEGKASVVSFSADQKLEKMAPLADMEMTIDFKAEWKQIFTDAWRFERDYFYDKNMHGVDWAGIRAHYEKLLDHAVTRWDVNFVLGEMISELNASHSYRGGGDTDEAGQLNTGYLGVDWEISNGYYRIRKIVEGSPWDVETRSPVTASGLNISQGDFVLAINGITMDINKDPYAAFQGLGGKTVELTINTTPSLAGSRKVIVKTLSDETRLRNLQWIESNRSKVEAATGGKVGYIYVPNTGISGQNELMRQFAAQWDKEGLIIDERFNSGGQIPDRFIELLDRRPLAYWAVRDGKDWQWPVNGNFGPKVMLINGWSGSGGDAFPDYFRKAGLGPLIGSRTWGGLIGISGVPSLIDGGGVTVPTFRMYDPDGKWFREGHGVDPDIDVREDPAALAKGSDNQLEKAIEEINRLIQTKPYKKPAHPPYEIR
ncbi:MAG TPA: PDZ domain-containing protein [Cyclobacteriaceae bacterium]|nr:PDZ domain-containing protein [Cyclobacteriaceae bacterium]